MWRYANMRPLLLDLGDLIMAEEAERRVLILEIPALPGRARATNTLYAGHSDGRHNAHHRHRVGEALMRGVLQPELRGCRIMRETETR